MIYTVTLNPSIDLFTFVDKIDIGEKNVITNEFSRPGGKAINVSRILSQMGIPTVATGFIGGYQGAFVKNRLNNEDIMTDFVEIQGTTRTNIKIIKDEVETTINSVGPRVSNSEISELIYYLSRMGEGDILILGGSVPPSDEGQDIYNRMISVAKSNGANFVADIPGKYLEFALKQKPFLVKPNESDIEELFQVKIERSEDLYEYGEKLIEMGAQNVIISYGKRGSMYFNDQGEIFQTKPIELETINTVACRDAMIAGFVGNYVKTGDNLQAYTEAVAAASATAMVQDLPSKEEILGMLDRVEILNISSRDQIIGEEIPEEVRE